MWIIVIQKAYLCSNIINFDEVDFSECPPVEVISFFWRSVYNYHLRITRSYFSPWRPLIDKCFLRGCDLPEMFTAIMVISAIIDMFPGGDSM